MNSVEIENAPKKIDIYWLCENEKVQIVKDSKVTNSKFGNFYGIYSFEIYNRGTELGTLRLFNYDKKRSYELKFVFTERLVYLYANKELLGSLQNNNFKRDGKR